MHSIPIYSLYWPNMSPMVVKYHKACWQKLGFDVQYTEREIAHPNWLDDVAKEQLSQHDAIAFVDIDCLAYTRAAVETAVDYGLTAGSFIGLAQSTNHAHPMPPVYAAPSFLVISRQAYEALGRPTLRGDRFRFDAAQNLSAIADAIGFGYRAMYPVGYHVIPAGGPWRLGNYGHYGIGTEFPAGFYHLFQSRDGRDLEMFKAKAEDILAGDQQPTEFPYLCQDLGQPMGTSGPSGYALHRWLRKRFRRL